MQVRLKASILIFTRKSISSPFFQLTWVSTSAITNLETFGNDWRKASFWTATTGLGNSRNVLVCSWRPPSTFWAKKNDVIATRTATSTASTSFPYTTWLLVNPRGTLLNASEKPLLNVNWPSKLGIVWGGMDRDARALRKHESTQIISFNRD